MSDTGLHGFVAEGYAPVRETFARHLASGEQRGGAFAVYRRGEKVVDLWGGAAHRGGRGGPARPWVEDTVSMMFSVTKGLAALVFLKLHEQGAFSYDEPVAGRWKSFGVGGKAELTIRTLLNHRAGLPAIAAPLTVEDVALPERRPKVVRALEAQAPLWAPDTEQAYHATSFGLFVAELFRRVCPERDLATFFRTELAEPLGADLWLCAPEALDPRIATLYPPSLATRLRGMGPAILSGAGADGYVGRAFITPGSTARGAFLNPIVPGGDVRIYDRAPARRTPLLWVNAVGNARGLARMYAPLANGGEAFGVRLVQAASLAPLHRRQSWSPQDRVLGKPLGWSQGFLKEETTVFCPHPESFGHAGLGGGLGWADPVTGTSIGYVTNTLDWRVRSRRTMELCDALYASPAMRD
jgi:CubicO group peptidase (beta-lactamase class C family)